MMLTTEPAPPLPLEPSGLYSEYFQFQFFSRIINRALASGIVARNVVVRQFLPITDMVQQLDWVVFADIDPRICSYSVEEWESAGAVNQYVEWRIGRIEPGDTVHIGYVAGLRHRRNRLYADAQGNCPKDLDPLPRSRTAPVSSLFQSNQTTSLDDLSPFPMTQVEQALAGLRPSTALPFPGQTQVDQQNPTNEEEVWLNAVYRTAALDWNTIEGLLQTHVDPSTSEFGPWYFATRTRRLAFFINAVIAGSLSTAGSTSFAQDDDLGWQNHSVPGAPTWPQIVLERAEVFWTTLGRLTAEAASGPVSIADVQDYAEDAYPPQGQYLASACTECTMLAMWFLRNAGIPCREMGGVGYRAGIELEAEGAGDKSRHRTIEVWDEELGGYWFPMNSTKPTLGPSYESLPAYPYLNRPCLTVVTHKGIRDRISLHRLDVAHSPCSHT